ncbi:hypothetical protein [Malonomonas rubra]|uniref:hypothetical protein n=1 Tax=Malonomonas rubra TaxID=57040 RepID=UPI0026EA31C9|nr:hypothetical protein [Malonomonas rubra]
MLSSSAPQRLCQCHFCFGLLQVSACTHNVTGQQQQQQADEYRQQKYRAALNRYQIGLKLNVEQEINQTLKFYWSTLEALELDNPAKLQELSKHLFENSAAARNLKFLQAIANQHFDSALSLRGRVTAEPADQEMKGWVYFIAARAWDAVGNWDKAFETLFFANNHARCHGLVSRITRFWEDLKSFSQPG